MTEIRVKNFQIQVTKNDPSQTVGIVLLLAGLLSILATKRKKILLIVFHT